MAAISHEQRSKKKISPRTAFFSKQQSSTGQLQTHHEEQIREFATQLIEEINKNKPSIKDAAMLQLLKEVANCKN